MGDSARVTSKGSTHAVILCHPSRHSFNAAAADAYCRAVREAGHRAISRDLSRISFDPVMSDYERPGREAKPFADDVVAELRMIQNADVLVLVYPIWFGSPPAMLKGYIDRVLGAGFSHRAVHAGARHPWLAGKALVSITSSGTPIQWLELKGARAAHRTLFVDYIAQSFGMASADHLHVPAVTDDLDPERFERHIASVTEQALATCVQLDRRQQDCDRQDSPATG